MASRKNKYEKKKNASRNKNRFIPKTDSKKRNKNRINAFHVNKIQLVLIGILIVGFILRILPISWGVPLSPFVKTSHPDEIKVLNTIIQFPEIYWTTQPFSGYGTAIQYIIAESIVPIKLLVKNIIRDSQHLYIFHITISRIFAVFFSMASLWLTYILGRKLFDAKTAVLATGFLAVSFYHTMNSAIITLDVSMGMMLLINYLLCIKAYETNKLLDYLALGIFSGILVGTKIVAGIFFAVPIFLLVWRNLLNKETRLEKSQALKELLKYSAVFALSAILIFIIFHPHIFLDIDKYLEFYIREKKDWVDRRAGEYIDLFHIFYKRSTKALGYLVPVLALLGFFTIPKKNRLYSLLVIYFILFYYLFWRWSLSSRYIISVAPFFCLFAASFCTYLYRSKRKLVKISGLLLVIATIGHSIYWCVQGVNNRLNDSRVDASEYIFKNIPHNSTIGISGVSERYPWTTHAWAYPRIFRNYYQIVDFYNYPNYLLIHDGDFDRVLKTLRSGKLSENYILPEEHHKNWYRYSAPTPRIFKFYDDLANNRTNYSLIKTIGSEIDAPLEFAAPVFRIYVLNNK